jgi:hypothetical protein
MMDMIGIIRGYSLLLYLLLGLMYWDNCVAIVLCGCLKIYVLLGRSVIVRRLFYLESSSIMYYVKLSVITKYLLCP